jgi:DNA-binding MarR family transcriptional regulator
MSLGQIESALSASPMEFADAMGRLRRSLRRAVRDHMPEPHLPASEREILMSIYRSPGIGVNEAADVLQAAPNTVSTLVTSLKKAGLIDRRPRPEDRRAAQLFLTRAGEVRIEQVRRHRAQVLDRAFLDLSDDDRDRLLGALPALDRLIGALVAGEAL